MNLRGATNFLMADLFAYEIWMLANNYPVWIRITLLVSTSDWGTRKRIWITFILDLDNLIKEKEGSLSTRPQIWCDLLGLMVSFLSLWTPFPGGAWSFHIVFHDRDLITSFHHHRRETLWHVNVVFCFGPRLYLFLNECRKGIGREDFFSYSSRLHLMKETVPLIVYEYLI